MRPVRGAAAAGLHCYDVFAGASRMAAMFGAEPGTYVLTDFLLRSFDRSVLAELGLDRFPQLWPDYFGHYRRLVWLAQEPTPALSAEAERVAGMFGLPLTRIDTGVSLERESPGAGGPPLGLGGRRRPPEAGWRRCCAVSFPGRGTR